MEPMPCTSAPFRRRSNRRNSFAQLKGITRAYIYAHSEAIEPNTSSTTDTGQTADFLVYLADSVPADITLYYRISGSAQNGVDYTKLNGFLTITGGFSSATITIQPLYDNLLEFDESVTLTLIPTNNYVVLPNQASATIYIQDNTNTPVSFDVVASGLNNPTGIDYHPLTNALIVTVNSFGSENYRFVRIGTNVPAGSENVTITNWSTITSADCGTDEPYFSIVKTEGPLTNAAGFTNGDLFFNRGDGIGWINTNGSASNPYWAPLSGGSFRGGLHVDRSGGWGGDLIGAAYSGRIYRVKPDGTNSLIASITTDHLEGALTLTNDVQRWGPLAGRVVTGDEALTPPCVYGIDTNGYVLKFNLGIEPEDFDVIPASQDLYVTDASIGAVVRLSASYFTNFGGDVLVTEAGEFAESARLFIVHWDGNDLTTRRIRYAHADNSAGHFEHSTFAPLHLSLPSP
jgi:hypothetical protein